MSAITPKLAASATTNRFNQSVMNALGIFSRLPRPGECKTRIADELGPRKAAALAAAFLADLTERFKTVGDRRFLCFTPESSEAADFFCLLAGDQFELWPQPAGMLDERMMAFFGFASKKGATRSVIIGSDAPTVPTEFIERSFALLDSNRVVLGPAFDGGFYMIGMQTGLAARTLSENWLAGIDWGGPEVFTQTLERAAARRVTLGVLPPWSDVDTPSDVEMLRNHLAAMRAAGVDPETPRTEGELLQVPHERTR